MPTCIALLRGINVGGQKLIRMVDLQRCFEGSGAARVRTYIQSGNVVFDHSERKRDVLRKSIETCLEKKFGDRVPTLVLTAQELEAIAAASPFDESLPELGRRLYVCFFEKTPKPGAMDGLKPYISEQERFELGPAAGYAYYAGGLGRARLSGAVIERKLGLATMRNWNTVQAMIEMSRER